MSENQFGSPTRERILIFILMGFFAVLVLNLFNMQIIQYYNYEEKSTENSVRQAVQNAPRGIFYDRDYNVLVSNKPSFTLQITPAFYDKQNTELIEKVLGVGEGYIDNILNSTRIYSIYMPRKIMRDVDFKFIAWLEENSEKLPGVEYIVELQRDYSSGIKGAHFLGYIKEISSEQYQREKEIYDLGDYVGFNGLEKSYESMLRGKKGIKYTLVDSKQKVISKYKDGLEDKVPIKGNDLVLSIDSDAQRIAEKAFKGKRGALVAIEPSTGEIIAFVSAPEYDLSDFTMVTSQDAWGKLNRDPDKPLFNRATMSIYSPGSTYKMITAIAGLEKGVITTNTHYTCSGGIYYGDRPFRCLHVHGRVNVVEAIEKSCNVFFYSIIQNVGLDNWSNYSHLFGFGDKTGIDIGEEIAGVVPSTQYYNRVYGKNGWTSGYLLSLTIGQGELSVTPLQLAKYVALIANNGHSAVPHFVKGIVYSDTHQYEAVIPKKINIDVSQSSFDIVREGMYKVVNGEGSARNIKMPNLKIAGKTGTAQNPFGEDHAFFVGFAPFDNPQIAVAVVVENAGFGSTHAAPIARDVMVSFINKNKQGDSKNVAALVN